jgi:RimJ/RimL family protein N-acetyltransferase
VTERLVLRRLDRECARALADGDYSSIIPAAGWPTDATAIVARRAATDPGAVTWLITYGGEVIGECGIKHAPDSGGATEIGYGLGAPWRANGYGTEAIRALVDWLDGQPGCRRVIAEAHQTNTASRRLLERLGFAVYDLRPPYVWYARDLH